MEHFYQKINGWASFKDIYSEMVRKADATGCHFVEIGSWCGKSAAFMAVEIINSGKQISFDCVDPWSDGGPDLTHKVKGMKEPLFDIFLRNIEPVKHIIRPLRMTSLEAAKLYKDESLDFVLVDGSHMYEDVHADILAWKPKVKKGGVIAGDDFNWEGVAKAVNELLPSRTVILGPKRPDTGKPSYKLWRVEC